MHMELVHDERMFCASEMQHAKVEMERGCDIEHGVLIQRESDAH